MDDIIEEIITVAIFVLIAIGVSSYTTSTAKQLDYSSISDSVVNIACIVPMLSETRLPDNACIDIPMGVPPSIQMKIQGEYNSTISTSIPKLEIELVLPDKHILEQIKNYIDSRLEKCEASQKAILSYITDVTYENNTIKLEVYYSRTAVTSYSAETLVTSLSDKIRVCNVSNTLVMNASK